MQENDSSQVYREYSILLLTLVFQNAQMLLIDSGEIDAQKCFETLSLSTDNWYLEYKKKWKQRTKDWNNNVVEKQEAMGFFVVL